MNVVILKANLTRDIELRAVGSGGQQVAQIGLALNRNYTTSGGEKREEVTFVDAEAWGKTAETMAKYLSKGRPVIVEGRLKMDQWDDKTTGKKQSKLKVVVEQFHFADSKPAGHGAEAKTRPDTAGAAIDDGDIPFDPQPAMFT